MRPDLRVLLFAIFGLIFSGTFVLGWAEAGNPIGGLILSAEILGMMIVIVLLFIVFLWIGSKIFHD